MIVGLTWGWSWQAPAQSTESIRLLGGRSRHEDLSDLAVADGCQSRQLERFLRFLVFQRSVRI